MGSVSFDYSELSEKIKPVTAEVSHGDKTYTIVREGLAEILSPKQPTDGRPNGSHERPRAQAVFYNPIQQFNRDLSVLAIRAFGEDLAVIRQGKQKRRKLNWARDDHRGQKRKRELADDGAQAGGAAVQTNSIADTGVGGNGAAAGSKIKEEETEGLLADVESNGLSHEQGTGEQVPGKTTSSSNFPFRILDALSATGLRAIRYAKEIPATTLVTANDLSVEATASINLNVMHNKIPHKINILTGDAQAHMYNVATSKPGEQTHYEVIDLDPYGTAAPFLDSAVRALVDGGLLCVTCTDAGVFASTGFLEKTFSQYGGLPVKGPQSHEGGLRIILHAIALCAARYGLSIEPLLSLSIDFYVRVFVRVYRSPAQVKFLASKSMIVYSCDQGCGAWTTQFLAQTREHHARNGSTLHKFTLAQAPTTSPYCEHCGFKTHLSGPMWGGPIHNPHFIRQILDTLPSLDRGTYDTIPRIEGMLSVAYEETLFTKPPQMSSDSDDTKRPVPQMDPTLRDHHPLFLTPSTLAKTLHCVGPPDAVFRGALKRLGYRTSRSHTKAGSIRTDAPWSVVWEVMREWVSQRAPIKANAIKKGTAGWGIMQKDRSKIKLNTMKMDLKKGLDKLDDISSMRTELEAMLYRLRSAEGEEEGKGEEEGEDGEVGGEGERAEPTVPTPDPPAAGISTEQPYNSNPNPPQSPTPPPIPKTAPPRKSSPTPIPTPTPMHELNIIFDMSRNARSPSPARKIVRYQMNPRPEWGPISRATGA